MFCLTFVDDSSQRVDEVSHSCRCPVSDVSQWLLLTLLVDRKADLYTSRWAGKPMFLRFYGGLPFSSSDKIATAPARKKQSKQIDSRTQRVRTVW
ncbi:hypothetical protein D3C87_1237660 [compost metagenome]